MDYNFFFAAHDAEILLFVETGISDGNLRVILTQCNSSHIRIHDNDDDAVYV